MNAVDSRFDAAAATASLLDGARRPLVRALVRVEPARRVFVDRRARVLASSLIAAATSFVVAAWQPLVSLWLGAALFGVPHVVAGLRQVAVRERRAPLTLLFVAAALVVGSVELCASGTRIADDAMRAYVLLFAAAMVSELGVGRARWWPLVAVAAGAGLVSPRVTLVALAHLHGLSAIGEYVRRARGRGIPAWPFVAAVAALMLAIAVGACDALFTARLWAPRSAAASLVAEAAGSAFDGASGVTLRRWLVLYAFGQALHFAIWLRLVPDIERDARVPHTFRHALRLFRADFGRWAQPVLIACVAAAPLLLVGGGRAREAYFALGYFHVGLEAAALVGRRRAPGSATCSFGRGTVHDDHENRVHDRRAAVHPRDFLEGLFG
jgi:hypothetical protein